MSVLSPCVRWHTRMYSLSRYFLCVCRILKRKHSVQWMNRKVDQTTRSSQTIKLFFQHPDSKLLLGWVVCKRERKCWRGGLMVDNTSEQICDYFWPVAADPLQTQFRYNWRQIIDNSNNRLKKSSRHKKDLWYVVNRIILLKIQAKIVCQENLKMNSI